jgi:cytochrome c biogenesis protein CcmG/thiol:disulfide interchange protein DsbE
MAGWFSEERIAAQGCSPDAPRADLDFTLKDMDGNDVTLSDLKGQVVLLNFWATWCAPCRLEIPWFVEFQEKYKDKGLRVVGVSVDDPPEALLPFARQFKVNYPLLVGRDREDVQTAFGPIFGVPITVIIGRDGRICVKHVGPVGKEQFENEIRSLL